MTDEFIWENRYGLYIVHRYPYKEGDVYSFIIVNNDELIDVTERIAYKLSLRLKPHNRLYINGRITPIKVLNEYFYSIKMLKKLKGSIPTAYPNI